ncbi:hypothetical protein BDB01DRAFT_717517 [Pilobolus umbonatus]|nr:hypothetical protein BDB01DRAFT_717517 [Pilobolus umbonatus]
MHTSQKYQKKVVVIGGGFTGFTAASILDPMPRFHVTLIDTKDSFEYTPGMIKLLVRPDETSSLRVRHDAYTKNGKVIIGYAENISHDAKCVRVNDEEIPFDYLVIATGSTYKSKLKSFDTSSLYRLSELSKEHLELKKAKSVLIIGGGLVGCELASEIAIHTYPPPYDAKKKITLIDSHATLVPRSSLKRRQNAMKYFADLGVEVVLNEKIVDFDVSLSNAYLGMTGKVYSGYDKVFVATGTSPCSHILLSNNEDNIELESCIDHWGRLRVKPTLQLDHHKYTHIFAGGDVTDVAEEKTGYSATLAGVCIARNICRIEKGKAPIAQGSKGTMSAPSKPLHGIAARGGVGRQKLSHFKKTFAFLNPTWAALKYFDENEFLEIVLGESRVSATAIGKKPKVLGLPHTSKRSDHSLLACKNKHTHQHHISQRKTLMPYEGSNEAVLSISATNLYGSDILACPCRNDSEIDATTIMESQPPSPTSITKSSDYLNWANEKLKPRPTPSSSNNSSLNLKKNLLSTQSKTPSNPSLLVTTEMRYHHRKLKSL